MASAENTTMTDVVGKFKWEGMQIRFNYTSLLGIFLQHYFFYRIGFGLLRIQNKFNIKESALKRIVPVVH